MGECKINKLKSGSNKIKRLCGSTPVVFLGLKQKHLFCYFLKNEKVYQNYEIKKITYFYNSSTIFAGGPS
jgi:hypothetical protein